MAAVTGPSPLLFFETAHAYQRTAALKTAIDLDLFTAVGDGAGSVAALAGRCHASPRGVRMLCDYLTAIGFLRKADGEYSLTEDSSIFLSKRSPAYVGGTLEFLASDGIVENFNGLTTTVKEGTVRSNTVSEENPVWVAFARAMVPLMMPDAELIAGVLGVESAGPLKVLDIAAGHGMFGITIARRNPQAEIYAVDWPAVLALATENAARAGVGARHHTIPGDAFKADFGIGYDVALVTNFLHHFDEETCTGFLKKVAAALKPGGRVVVLDFVPNEDRVSPPLPAMFAMNMLGGTPAGEVYPMSAMQRMLGGAGFHGITAHPGAGPATVIIGRR